MIDIEKYTGHLANEGQTWAWSKWMLKNAETIEQHKATSALLEDAPLLLAEVKRLREEIKDYDACLQNLWDKELIPEDTDIWDEVKELLEVD